LDHTPPGVDLVPLLDGGKQLAIEMGITNPSGA
jgi:hypothetical protein